MSDDLKEHVTDTNIWLRLLFMLVFAVVFAATRVILTVVIAGQFLWVLFTGNKNDKLLDFAARLATFIYQIYRYLSFNTEKRPFPFDDFPDAEPLYDDSVEETADAVSAEADSAAEPGNEEKLAEEPAAEKKKPAKRKPAATTEEADDAVEAASETGVESEEKEK